MSPYANELAHARLSALRKLIAALNEAETPDEKRRCAVAIFKAPDPCDLDDEIELVDDDEDEKEEIDDRDDGERGNENKDCDEDDPDEEDPDDSEHIDDVADDDDGDEHEPTTTRQPVSRSLAALSERPCDCATTSLELSPSLPLQHTRLSQSPISVLPAPSGPAAKLIATAGRAPLMSNLPASPATRAPSTRLSTRGHLNHLICVLRSSLCAFPLCPFTLFLALS